MTLSLNNASFSQICAFGTVIHALESAIARYEEQLATGRIGYVYCWPNSGLCVSLVDGKSRVVGADQATGFSRKGGYVFTNGKGEQAQLITRERALSINLDQARKSIDGFRAQLEG